LLMWISGRRESVFDVGFARIRSLGCGISVIENCNTGGSRTATYCSTDMFE
jgi:hypothetical protein